MSTKDPLCAVCNVPAVQLCAGCKLVYYCSREHQKKHWKGEHKNQCSPYKIVDSSSNGGKHMIAPRDIKQNEVIFREEPFVVAPYCETSITCLGCNKTIEEDAIYRCSKCNWPVCSANCEKGSYHKKECDVLKESQCPYRNNRKISCAYKIIAPLRILLTKADFKSKFDQIVSILRQGDQVSSYIEQHKDKLLAKIIHVLKSELRMHYSEGEIAFACSIFNINAIDVVKEDGKMNIRGFYPLISAVKYDCVSNTKYVIDDNNLQLSLIATVPIPKGQLIKIAHGEIFWGTLARRAFLKERKFFDCCCKRCSDKTELSTYLGAIFCSWCKTANEESCPKIVSTNPLDPKADWKCEKCQHTLLAKQMVWGNNAIKSEQNKYYKNPLQLEKFIEKYKETLHEKNYHVLVAKYTLTKIYGNVPGYLMPDLTETILERKIEICHELLEIVEQLAPGYSTIRGSLLYDLQAAMVFQAKREYNSGKVTKATVQETLNKCMMLLKEAAEILSTEPQMKEFLQEKLQELITELDF